MIIGALDRQGPQNALESLRTPAGKTGACSTCARLPGAGFVGVVLVELPLQGASRQTQRATACRGLQGFQIDLRNRLATDQGFDLLRDLGLEARREPPFLTASPEAAATPSNSSSAHCSQIFQ